MAMRTLRIDRQTRQEQLAELERAIDEGIRSGKSVVVTIGDQAELLSPAEAGQRLGFSRQHVRRLIDAGELRAERMEGSAYWKVPLAEVLAFEERSAAARARADAFSRSLDELGAPPE